MVSRLTVHVINEPSARHIQQPLTYSNIPRNQLAAMCISNRTGRDTLVIQLLARRDLYSLTMTNSPVDGYVE